MARNTGKTVVIIKCCRLHTQMCSLLHILWIWKDYARSRRCRRHLNAACDRRRMRKAATATTTTRRIQWSRRHSYSRSSCSWMEAQRRDISPCRIQLWSSMRLEETFLNGLTCSLCPSLSCTLVYGHVNSRITIQENRIAHRGSMWVPNASGVGENFALRTMQ